MVADQVDRLLDAEAVSFNKKAVKRVKSKKRKQRRGGDRFGKGV
jgi:hypothetical protein